MNAHEAYRKRCVTTLPTVMFGNYERLQKSQTYQHKRGILVAEPKNGRPIFFPEKLVIWGNLGLFVWILLDTAAFALYNVTAGIAFFVLTLILIYLVLNILGCLRPCHNCIKCTHGMGRLAALYFGRRIFKDYKYNYKLPGAVFFTVYIGALPAAFALYSTIADYTPIKAVVTATLLALTVYSASTWRPKKPKTT